MGETVLSRSNFRDYTSKLYEIISTRGPGRDWESVRALCHPDARLVRACLSVFQLASPNISSVAA